MHTYNQSHSLHPRVRRGFFAIHFVLLLVIAGLLGGYFTLNAATSNRNKPLVFQGRITNASYVPLSDGASVFLKYIIYDAATDGNCLWGTGSDATGANNCPISAASSTAVSTTVTRGVFTAALGDTTVTNMPALPLDFNSGSYYIGVSACTAASSGCDAEMTPRVRIGGAAYAYNSDELDGRNSSQFLLRNETLTLPAITDVSETATTTIMAFGAHTNRPNSELIDFRLNLGRTVSFTGGGDAFTQQRAFVVSPPTYAAAAAQSIGTVATMSIDGAPAISGANITENSTGRAVLWLEGDNLRRGVFLHMNYPSAETARDWVIGTNVNFSSNLTVDGSTASQRINGHLVSPPVITNAGATTVTMAAYDLTGAGAINTTNAGGTTDWFGQRMVMPAITQTSGSTNAIGIDITEGAYTSGTSTAMRFAADGVAHGLTSIAPTNVVYQLATLNGNGTGTGGSLITGLSDNASAPGMRIVSIIGSPDPTDATPALYLSGAKSDGGTTRTTLSDAETVLQISNNNTIRVTLNGSGDLGLGDPTPNGTLDLLSSSVASSTSIIITNTGGSDAVINFEVTENTGAFSLGVDNDNGDQFTLDASGTLGTTPMWQVNSAATSNTVYAHVFDTPNPTFASAASAFYTTFLIDPPTLTLTGTTPVTSMMEAVNINTFSITDSSAVTVDSAALFSLDGAPSRAGNVTLTDTYGLYIRSAAVSTAVRSTSLYVNAQTGATNNYAAVFATGNVGIGVTTPAVKLDIDGGISLRDSGSTNTITADDTTITVGDRSYIKISSDSSTATDRTFILTQSTRSGQIVILEFVGTGTNTAELADDAAMAAGNIRLSATWNPTQYDTITLISNGTDWVELSRSTN